MKKLLVFISCLVLSMSLSLTAFATPSPSVLGEVFTNEDGTTDDKKAEVLGETWGSDATSGDEDSTKSPKTADSSVVVYVAGLGAVLCLTAAKARKRMTV